MSPRQRRGRLYRVVRGFAVTLIALWGVYLVAMNGFLSSPLFAKVIDAEPLVIDVHYARAWSWLPQHIHAEGLSIRGTDSHVEWILKLDSVDFDVSLASLGRQYFHVTRARGTGISFRLRMKVPSPAETARYDELRPPIDGLPGLSIQPDEPPYAGTWDDARWKLWTIQLDDVVASDVREVWFQHARVEGSTRIAGSFRLKPIREVRVGPIDMTLAPGSRVAIENEPFAEQLGGTLFVQVDTFDPRGISTDELLHHVTVRTDVRLDVADVGHAGVELPAGFTLHGGATLAPLALRIDHGVLADGTDVDLVVPTLDVARSRRTARTAAHAHARVQGGTLDGRAWLEHVAIDAIGSAEEVDAHVDSTRLDLGVATFEDLHGTVDARGLDASLGALLDAESSELRVGRGHARGELHLEGWVPDARVKGRATIALHGVAASAKGAEMTLPRADVDAWVDAKLDAESATGAVDVHATRARIAEGERAIVADFDARGSAGRVRWGKGDLFFDALDARIDASRASLVLSGTEAAALGHARLRATAQSFTPTSPFAAGHVDVTIADARVTHGEALAALFPEGSSVLLEGASGALSADASLDFTRAMARGRLALRGRRLGFVTRDVHVIGDIDAHAAITKLDLKGGRLGGDVEVSVAGVTGGLTDAARTDFTMDRLDLRLAAPALDLARPSLADVDAELHVPRAEVRDARAFNRVLPSGPLFAIEAGRAVVRADLETHAARSSRAGEVVVDVPDAAVRFHDERVTGDVHVEAHLAQAADAREAIDVSGTRVGMRDVRVTGSSADTAGWSGELVVTAGTARVGPTRIDGDVRLEASDARPVLALLLGNAVPGFVVGMIDMPHLRAETHLRFEPDLVALTGASADGSNFGLHGVYVVSGARKLGAFVAEKGPLSLGLRIDEGGVHPHFFGLDGWYHELEGKALQLACAPEVLREARCDLGTADPARAR